MLAAGVLTVISLILQWLARTWQAFADFYAQTVYRFFVATVGRVMSVFPFSVVEIGLYIGILLLIVGLAVLIGNMIKGRLTILHGICKAGSVAFLCAAILLLTFTLGGGINYHRTPFSTEAGFTLEEYSQDQLAALCRLLVEEINEAAEEIQWDEENLLVLPDDMNEIARTSMYQLGASYPQLRGYYPNPKAIQFSRILSVQKIEGIYSPFTIEANYNKEMPAVDIPVTICHELSHLRGYMREEEANFIAYLACSQSDNSAFRYSGAILAWIYCGNALYRDGAVDLYREIASQLCEEARKDLQENNQFWKQFDGKIAEVSDQVNDTYLKINKQEAGSKSYGRMVDLLLGYYEKEIS